MLTLTFVWCWLQVSLEDKLHQRAHTEDAAKSMVDHLAAPGRIFVEYVCPWGRVSRNSFALVMCDELLHQKEQTALCRQAWPHVKQWRC